MSAVPRIYLDNAATTPLAPQVLEAMLPYLSELFGNPSSIHGHGREVRVAIEKARKTIAGLINCSPGEIIFTSGGTEADNMVIHNAVHCLGVKRIITSAMEHHAVLHTVTHTAGGAGISYDLVRTTEEGFVDMHHLEELLQKPEKTLVSLMHGNNEVGNMIDLQAVADMCKQYGALFHSDTVQTMGHYAHDMQKTPVDFIVGAAHKFHGPKGVGFLFRRTETQLPAMIHGGSQERNLRGGTENVAGIIGMAKALEIAYADMAAHQLHIRSVKQHMVDRLREVFSEEVRFNGGCCQMDRSLYTVLNVSLPESEDNDMLLFNLDIAGISASGGSACSSGSEIGSHVLAAIGAHPKRGNVRFSFSKYTTKEEIDTTVKKLSELYAAQVAGA